MKILFIQISINKKPVYRAGPGYIIGLLKEEGHEVRLFDVSTRKEIKKLSQEAERFNPGIIAFSSLSTEFKWASFMAAILKKTLRARPLIICGGIHPTLEPGCILESSGLDGIVRGEGEYPLLELAQRIEQKKPYFDIQNFYFKAEGKIIKNDLRPLIGDLDALPFPERPRLKNNQLARFIFSRGCPFNCSFCCNHALNRLYKSKTIRFRSPEKALEEIVRVVSREKGIEYVLFDDDVFTINKKWLYSFLKLYKKHVPYEFLCNIRADTTDLETLKLLKNSGCVLVQIGIETGNEEFRRKILRKPISNAQIARACEWASKLGLMTSSFNMLGLPFETPALFQQTVRFNKQLKIDFPTLGIFHPYPGTELCKVCLREKFVREEDLCGNLNFVEREDTLLDMPGFSRKAILRSFKEFRQIFYPKKR